LNGSFQSWISKECSLNFEALIVTGLSDLFFEQQAEVSLLSSLESNTCFFLIALVSTLLVLTWHDQSIDVTVNPAETFLLFVASNALCFGDLGVWELALHAFVLAA
jgi:hypothetical protein